MPTRVAYGKRDAYPSMKPADVAIWEKFMTENPDAFDWCEYDVAVGDGAAFDTVVNTDTGGDCGRLYQWKIDVVAGKGEDVFVIEVKPSAGLSAIGQALNYTILYEEEIERPGFATPMIITDRVRPDIPRLCAHHGVEFKVV